MMKEKEHYGDWHVIQRIESMLYHAVNKMDEGLEREKELTTISTMLEQWIRIQKLYHSIKFFENKAKEHEQRISTLEAHLKEVKKEISEEEDDPKCRCGHKKSVHGYLRNGTDTCGECFCKEFHEDEGE